MATGGSKPEKPVVDVVGIGPVRWDRFVIVPRLPAANEQVKAIRIEEIVGGTATTALVALRRWKLRCRLISTVGYDEHSVRIVDDLTQEGIETDGLLRREDAESHSSTILVDHRNGTRAIIDSPHHTEPSHHLREQLLRAWWFEEARLMHVEVTAELAGSNILRHAKEAGLKIVACLNHAVEPKVLESLKEASWAIADGWTATELTKETDPSRAAYVLHMLLDVPTLVYAGRDGAHYVCGRETHHQPSVEMPVVDRSGSGAVFQAGFMYGILSAWDISRSMRVATWAAGMACREVGGRKGIPTESQIKQFLVEE